VQSHLAVAVLREGLDDWVPLVVLDGLARKMGARNDVESRTMTLDAVRELVNAGLIRIGEVSDGGFVEWGGSVDSTVSRLEEVWSGSDRNVWGFSAWTCNTSAGDREASSPR
jgi:hypothetical protein